MKSEEQAFDLLRAMKNREFPDGSYITGFTVTFTDKKTGDTRVVEI